VAILMLDSDQRNTRFRNYCELFRSSYNRKVEVKSKQLNAGSVLMMQQPQLFAINQFFFHQYQTRPALPIPTRENHQSSTSLKIKIQEIKQ
jgi:hypothetical protein